MFGILDKNRPWFLIIRKQYFRLNLLVLEIAQKSFFSFNFIHFVLFSEVGNLKLVMTFFAISS